MKKVSIDPFTKTHKIFQPTLATLMPKVNVSQVYFGHTNAKSKRKPKRFDVATYIYPILTFWQRHLIHEHSFYWPFYENPQDISTDY